MNLKNILLLIFILPLFSCNQDVKFDSEKWKNAGGENIMLETRLNMANNLIESEILLNKSKSEITELIGPPTRIQGKEVDSIQFYAVKEIYGSNIDPNKLIYLKIVFTDKEKATSVKLYSTK